MMTTTVKLSSKGQVVIPKEVRNTFHWGTGTQLTLVTTGYGAMLQNKTREAHKIPAKSLRGFLQHTGKPVLTETLCKPVEYADDRL